LRDDDGSINATDGDRRGRAIKGRDAAKSKGETEYMKSTAYRMPAGQGPGYRVVCSICRKTQTAVHRFGKDALVLNDGVVHYGPLSSEAASAVSHAHNRELH